eukprot:1196415-Prorocentrum_minimum.AAC.1
MITRKGLWGVECTLAVVGTGGPGDPLSLATRSSHLKIRGGARVCKSYLNTTDTLGGESSSEEIEVPVAAVDEQPLQDGERHARARPLGSYLVVEEVHAVKAPVAAVDEQPLQDGERHARARPQVRDDTLARHRRHVRRAGLAAAIGSRGGGRARVQKGHPLGLCARLRAHQEHLQEAVKPLLSRSTTGEFDPTPKNSRAPEKVPGPIATTWRRPQGGGGGGEVSKTVTNVQNPSYQRCENPGFPGASFMRNVRVPWTNPSPVRSTGVQCGTAKGPLGFHSSGPMTGETRIAPPRPLGAPGGGGEGGKPIRADGKPLLSHSTAGASDSPIPKYLRTAKKRPR